MSTSFAESVLPIAQPKQTLTDELQDNLNNIELSRDRIARLIDTLYERVYGPSGSIDGTRSATEVPAYTSIKSLNNDANTLAVTLNDVGDKLEYLVSNL